MTEQPARRMDNLAPAYFDAVAAAADAYLETGSIPEDLADALDVLASAMTASNMVAITARLTQITRILEDKDTLK